MAFQDHFGYHGPTRLIMGRGTIGNIPQILNEQQVKKAQIVTDGGLVQAGVVAHVTEYSTNRTSPTASTTVLNPTPPFAMSRNVPRNTSRKIAIS